MKNPYVKDIGNFNIFALWHWKQFGFGVYFTDLVPYYGVSYDWEVVVHFMFFKIHFTHIKPKTIPRR